MTRSPASALNFRTWLLGHVLLVTCTAPPRADPPPPARLAPLPTITVTLVAPGMSAEHLKTDVVAVVERALAPIPEVDALVARVDDDRATIAAIVTSPDALAPIRAALTAAERDLPSALEPPQLSRASDEPPVFALRQTDNLAAEALKERIERIAGVGRVELCGGRDPVQTIGLDRRRLTGVAIDQLTGAVRERLLEPDARPPDPASWRDTAIPGTPLKLGDLATITATGRPRACADLVATSDVTVLVHAQRGADRRRVAADLHAAGLRAALPPHAGPVTILPARDGELAELAVELEWSPEREHPVNRCLNDSGIGPWILLRPAPAPDDGPVHARLLLTAPRAEPGPPAPAGPPAPTRSIEHVREDLLRCTGATRVAVLAPEADADHRASVELLGPDPVALTDLADRAAARLRDLPGVTLLRVHAARPRPTRELKFDRTAAADRGVRIDAFATATRLAAGPLELGDVRGVPVLLDMLDRPESFEHVLADLSVSSPGGPVPLSALASVAATLTHAPLYRIARSDAAALELRLRRAADREVVRDVLAKELELPAGVQLRLGREFPPLDP